MMTTKLILTHDVTNLGAAGEVVEVKDGYARNYLVPRGLAAKWTKGAQKQIDQMTAARRRREIASIEDARVVRDALQEARLVTVQATVGASGRLFGAVSTADVAEAVKAQTGQTVDRRKIVTTSALKTVGDHAVTINLHPEVSVSLTVRVTAAPAVK
ncbi:MAG: 50S ribosomal protein L9 [Actinomyces sp.]|nr:50S ribosomal protein L9 [Actinomyces sp.]MCI1642072.1 50S ribosomal protein L9 [Actinomyces sp.]MCI1661486.1 50S ribosomal protein L9 [Actinomyces sp.]MCI1690850.1 50S ribosomal protein L9 [Actinomyces sp.]MCI1788187.1 50S ribosomal protein L9 [Actinomyces sp.]MCI1830082.1 50S ribosomal protein L9 [Actinomyces sp.]